MIGTAGNEMWANREWSKTGQGKTGGPIQLKGYRQAICIHKGVRTPRIVASRDSDLQRGADASGYHF